MMEATPRSTTMGPLKICFLPFTAPGHIIPLVHIARLFATKGEHVTIITTRYNAKLFEKTIEQDRSTYGSNIGIHTVMFPSEEVGLPEGLENLGQVSDATTAAKLHSASGHLQNQVEAFMEANPPHVFVTDMTFTWSLQSATRLKIPRVVFNPMSIFVSCVTDAIKKHPEVLPESDSEATFVVKGLPHQITLNVKPSPGYLQLVEAQVEGEQKSIGVILNSFVELEEEYAEHYEKVTGCKVWHVGPALLMLKKITNMDDDLLGNKQQNECLNWLNNQERNSVVYISFGSLCRFTDEQLFEIACGMEASGYKFIWVVHRKDHDGGDDKWLPSGFEERLREQKRMIIYRGWAPQVLILNHPAIGGFLTHSAWNAMAEAISAGVPLITMPGFGDQYYNEKLISQVQRFGVEVGDQVWALSPYTAKKKLVRRESIERAVRRLMDGGDEADQIRRRVKELQEKARKAVEPGGSSDQNLNNLIQHMKLLVSKNEKLLKEPHGIVSGN